MTATMMAAAGVAIVTGQEFDMTAGTASDLSGFNDGPGPDYGSVAGSPGSLDFKSSFVVGFRFEDDAPLNFRVAMDGIDLGQTFFTRVTVVGDAWDVDLLTADADRYTGNENSDTNWEWDLPAHAVFTDSDPYLVTLYE